MVILVQGFKCIVDEEDYEWVNELEEILTIRKGPNHLYVYVRTIPLHKLIFAVSNRVCKDGNVIDHINRNSLDNRRINLRSISNMSNLRLNSRKRPGTSKYVGVYKNFKTGKWCAQYSQGAENVHIGTFSSELEAARIHDIYLITKVKNPLRLNFPEEALVLKEMLDRNG